MARRTQRTTVGVEEARRRLPALLAAAHRGEVTIVTKHGRPHAALVPVAGALSARGVSVASLRGSGKGLWGDGAAYVARARKDWT
jgi:prevent-host-death family protein